MLYTRYEIPMCVRDVRIHQSIDFGHSGSSLSCKAQLVGCSQAISINLVPRSLLETHELPSRRPGYFALPELRTWHITYAVTYLFILPTVSHQCY